MLSDEEREAMKYFYNLRATIDESNMLFDEDIDVKCGKETIKQITILLNLIEKQSKEIEELKEKDDANLAYYDQIYQNGIYTGQKAVEYKIKAKIEEVDKTLKNNHLIDKLKIYFEAQKEVLQSLLEKE